MKFQTLAISAALATPVVAVAGLKLTRSGYESPNYSVVQEIEGAEIRRYPTMAVVSTKRANGAGNRERDSRFMRLFGYIDKGNDADQKIAMTTPVLMGANDSMSFVIPTEVAEKGSPSPKSKDVFLDKFKGGTFAAMRFKGGRGEAVEEEAVARLRKLLATEELKPATKAEPIFAYYDPPWTPKFLRRNEVLLRLKP